MFAGWTLKCEGSIVVGEARGSYGGGVGKVVCWNPSSELVGNGHVCATVEKVKHSAGKKSFIPSGVRSYTILRPRARTEFRHDWCNTAPIWRDAVIYELRFMI
jgi:hypothetical protein